QKKQLVLATITVLVFCAVILAGMLLMPIFSSNATSTGGNDQGENFEYPEFSAPANVVAPQRVDGLVYNGRPQTLITAGQDDITYSLEHDGEFTRAIPTAIDAGNYCVFYKVADDKMIYNLHSEISKIERTVSCALESWHYGQRGNELEIDLPISDGVTEPQITYYQRNGKILYEKPTKVGQYTVKVFVPSSANYQACSTTQDFVIYSQIKVVFDSALYHYQNVEINLGAQTPLTINPQHGVMLINALSGTQILTVTADGKEIFQQEITNAEINQTIMVEG
ncbi:MAG: hypothetical protein NC133_04505, partial [Prevotella sp.]|nr:hypothetical protein [Prevotella sp.]